MMSTFAFPLETTGPETEYQEFQLFFSTAEIAASLFYGDMSPPRSFYTSPQVPAGIYYLLEGELRPLVEGPPPSSVPLSEESGLFRLETRVE